MKGCRFLVLCFALVGFLSACAPTPTGQPVAAVRGGPMAWIDAPLDGSTLPLAPYEIVFHCSAPSDVAWVELSVDGAVLVSNAPPDTTQC